MTLKIICLSIFFIGSLGKLNAIYNSTNLLIDTCKGECIRNYNVKSEVHHETLFGAEDGSIKLIISDVKNYHISWYNKQNLLLKKYNDQRFLKDLKNGLYCYKIESEAGCYLSNCIQICPYISIKARVIGTQLSGCASSNGVVILDHIKIKGGENPFRVFSLKDCYGNENNALLNNNSLTFQNLYSGKYILWASDNVGCQASGNDTINLETKFQIKINEVKKNLSSKEIKIQIITNIKDEAYHFYAKDEENSELKAFSKKINIKNVSEKNYCFIIYGEKSFCQIDTCYHFN